MISPYQQINNEVTKNEKLLWSGQPKQGLKFSAIDWFLIPFTILWITPSLGILAAGEINVQNNTPLPFLVIPMIFLVIGAYLLVGRFWVDSFRRKNTFYGLTDQRAIIISRSGVKSIRLSNSSEIQFKPHKNDLGTIQFGAGASLFSMNPTHALKFWSGIPMTPSFEAIEGASMVYKQIKENIGL